MTEYAETTKQAESTAGCLARWWQGQNYVEFHTHTQSTRQRARQPAVHILLNAFVLTCLVFASCSSNRLSPLAEVPAVNIESNQVISDEAFHRIAADALGEREGAVIIIDPQTGRLRAVVNARVVFEQAFPPGSAIKPFTALAALKAGLLDLETKRQCQTTYARGDFRIVCSHPRSNAPFNLTQALAYSCNDYFAHVGERLSEGTFNATLKSFGFGQRTGVAAGEATGSLSRGDWQVRTALGDDDKLLVTPVQMLMAYAALVNGGHLFAPRQTSDTAFRPQQTASVFISPAQRKALIEGMRGAVKYGTAEKAQLGKLPGYVFGKTGTSTASNGFRTQGWFVGFAADAPPTGVPAPEKVKLGVLVFLRRAHGAQAAEIAKPILDCGLRPILNADCGLKSAAGHAQAEVANSEKMLHRSDAESAVAQSSFPLQNLCVRLRLCGEVGSNDEAILVATANPQSAFRMGRNPQWVRVRSISENMTRELSLEEYVAGVLAGEASIEKEFEALKAQAVTSRTFALKNLGRHAREGYDFCSTTHCQRFVLPQKNLHSAAQQAVAATRGEILRDRAGQPIDAYFHAACGGVTANIASLWGVDALEYLRGVRDDFCVAMPHRRWEQTIPSAQLASALQSDVRTNVGASLKSITISKHDATGRAEWLVIEGERRINVRGWDFKLIVGRALGWQMIKSSNFDVSRAPSQSGDSFVFRGGGFGHGLGLCQEGARGAARRGLNYRQIVSFYFPGARLTRDDRLIGSNGADSFGRSLAAIFPSPAERLANVTRTASSRCATKGSSVATAQSDNLRNTRRQRGLLQAFDGESQSSSGNRAGLTTEHFQATIGAGNDRREAERALRILETARSDIARRLRQASLRWNDAPPFEVVLHSTTEEFIAATGLSGWAAGATRGRRIELQPLRLLEKRNAVTTTLRHELTHAFVEGLGKGRAPRWLAEGLCLHVSGEGSAFKRLVTRDLLSTAELERRLAQAASATEARRLYAMAYAHVQSLIKQKGEPYVWQLVAKGGA